MSFFLTRLRKMHLFIVSLVLIEPPYKIMEKGWGEFEMAIKILFKDKKFEPLLLSHELHFLPSEEVDIILVLFRSTILFVLFPLIYSLYFSQLIYLLPKIPNLSLSLPLLLFLLPFHPLLPHRCILP